MCIRDSHLTVPYRQLLPDAARSLSARPALEDNVIIHGDNLHALKALLPSYSGRVKCIYIDPPYNTGNEGWVYNDNVNSPMHQAWLNQAVDRSDPTWDDLWLC
jgi:adenine-specific DNA-methyltransferase